MENCRTPDERRFSIVSKEKLAMRSFYRTRRRIQIQKWTIIARPPIVDKYYRNKKTLNFSGPILPFHGRGSTQHKSHELVDDMGACAGKMASVESCLPLVGVHRAEPRDSTRS